MADPIRIFAFINSGKGTDWCSGMAMDEHGVVVAQHVSSSDRWAMRDLGADGANAMHYSDYVERYGEGNFVVEWVDDPRNHAGLMAAYRKNQERRAELEKAQGGDRG